MANKQLMYDVDARGKFLAGIQKLTHAVAVTLGPTGKNVILEKSWGSPTSTKDGVTVSKEIDLPDPFENMGAKLVNEVAQKSADEVGDGTTTATILAEAIYREGLKALHVGINPMALKRGIDESVAVVAEELKRLSRPVKKKAEIAQVARVSANNDQFIGDLIADAMEKVGHDGVITVEENKSVETELKVVDGMQFDKGYISPYFVTNVERMEAEFENCLILFHEKKISSIREMIPLLEKVATSGRPLVIVAEEVDSDALAGLVVNRIRGVLKCCAVKAPGFGDRRKAILGDLAVLTGGELISEDLGVKLADVELAKLGQAKQVVITKDNTTITGGKGKKEEVQARVAQIKSQIETTTSNYDREKLEERLAKLTTGVAVINVGGTTETEMKERKARVEDALHATRAAHDEGIVPGGGVALLRATGAVQELRRKLKGDERHGADIVARALEAPLRQIAENSGVDGSVVVAEVRERKEAVGYDARTGAYTDMFSAGIVDPKKVTRVALQHAASIAGLLLTTEVAVTEIKEKAKAVAGSVV